MKRKGTDMNLFIITGVCQPGEDLSYLLPRFLTHPENQILLWIDFKNLADYQRSADTLSDRCPQAVLRCAPRALWGSVSIVTSMLDAVATALQDFTGWHRIVFCSIRDVPLVSRDEMVGRLERDWDYDYCGSRWNHSTSELLRPIEMIPSIGLWEPIQHYRSYQIRPDVTLRVDEALTDIYAPDMIASLRLCHELYQRYYVAAREFQPKGTLTIERITRARAKDRLGFFGRYGLVAGRQWCVLSRKFCDQLMEPTLTDVLSMFHDVVIPDECFFQTVAGQLEGIGEATVKWDNIYYADAQNMLINVPALTKLVSGPSPGKLLARKADSSITDQVLEDVLA
jgi:hypothetical protein